ncbi:ABC transporter ATP-binding protein [Mycolicibacterium chitae]|uniref:ABC transporter--like protein n=1 Tax=Mycolicibacterium chitae TaxID=1792 RepID=A0A448I779_MYCCI|nr:zinc ABC transporter ATP-binding protein AztA [Mycolicibacterium chitae]MCV7108096.1 metal ABC transporter ATP-binding protein [Mycolicibacterium chitae]BBZ04503.1 ABC transporter ATP-binding protein [Mycolicibacterium chitae]VEG48135.1 ABC transporter--like protein [Mycolicibacterium chitae]
MNPIFNKTATVAPPGAAVSGVDFDYRSTAVFRQLTLSFQPGVVNAVVGPNGCGKSTLLALLAGVLRPAAGTVRVDARDIAFAVQRSAVTDTFPITVAAAVMMGRWRRLGLLRRPSAADRAAVQRWISELGLTDLCDRTLGELSGGQRQRVLLAQALAQEAPLLLLDEPSTGLDTCSAARLIEQLHRCAGTGTTVIVATHDSVLIEAADQFVELG